MNREIALHFFAASLHDLEKLLKDVPEARWAEQPAGVRNHPAWTLGHLCCGHHHTLSILGQEPACPASWLTTMDMGTSPVADPSVYPSADELWSVHRSGHQRVAKAVRSASDETLSSVFPIEAWRSFVPTIGHLVAYMLLSHEPTHHGQLVAWKRALSM